MDLIAPLLLTGLTITLLGAWLVLLAAPLLMASGGVLAAPANAALQWLRTVRDDVKILVLDGLGKNKRLERRLRGSVMRTLRTAPIGSRAKACGCVKRIGDDAWVGVLRVSNKGGHYAVRTEGAEAQDVVRGLMDDLGRHDREFPARVGAKRIKIPECKPATCPLCKLAPGREVTAAAA